MAEINEIVSKEAIQSIKDADSALVKFDGDVTKLINSLKGFSGGGTGLADLNVKIKETTDNAKKLNEVQKQQAKIINELQKAGAARAAAMDKEIAKEKELAAALRGELGAYKQLTTQVSQAKKAYLEIAAAQGISSKAAKEAKITHDNLNKTLTDLNRSAAIYSPEVGKYGMMWDKVKGLAMGAVGALGLTAGIAGAMKIAQGIMQSTDAAADEFEKTMSGLKESVQFTARAFANFDFSNFLAGLAEANKEGQRYAETLDLIGDLNRANQLQQNDIEKQILEQRIIAKNKSNELSVREGAIKEIIRLEELKLSQTQVITKKGIDNELQNSAFRTKAQEKDVLDLVKNYDKKVSAIEQGNKLIQKIEAETRSETVTPYGTTVNVDTKAREKAFASLTESQKESVKWAKIDKQLTEEKRNAIVSAVDADQKATNEMLSGKEGLIRLENSLRSELIKTEKAQVTATEKQVGAYAKLTQSISDSKEEINNLLALGQTPSTELLTKLQKDEEQLIAVGKAAEFAALKLVAMQQGNITTTLTGKGASSITTSAKGGKSRLAARTTDIGGAPTATEMFAEGELSQLAIDAAQTTSDATFQIIADSANAELDLKLGNLEKEKEAKLKNTKLTEAQKAKIEEEYNKKAAKLKTENAKKEKAAAIIQSIISGVLAVLKAGGLTNPAGIAAAISAAAQTAVIVATKIPQFDKGTLSSPDTFTMSEKRPEFLVAPSGQISYVPQKTTFSGMAGSTVISGEDTDRIMKAAGKDGLTGFNFTPAFSRLENKIVDAVKSQSHISINPRTGRITDRKDNYSREYFNRLFKA